MGWFFIGLLAVLLGMVVAAVVAMRRRTRVSLHQDSISPSADLDILNEQLVRGEITREEYVERSREIQARHRVA